MGNIDSGSEEARKKSAAEKGLSENATWKDINDHSSEEARKKSAAEKGLPENATWKDINHKK